MIKSTYDFLREKVQTVTPVLAYDGGDYAAWKSVARETLADLLGMDKFEQVAPDTHIEYTQKIDGATEIRFDFESETGYRVPCHLWLPDGVEKPPVIICLQGHAPGMHISLARLKDESEAKKTAGKMAKTVTYSWDRDEQGEKRYYLKGGKKYCEVFQQLCDALNSVDQAAIDKACKASVAIFEGARAEGQKKSEGRSKTEDVHQTSAVSPQPSTGYSKEDVAEMLRKVLAGGDIPEDIKKLLDKAA